MDQVFKKPAPTLPRESTFSELVRQFLDMMLQKEPKRRATATAMKAHVWLDNATSAQTLRDLGEWITGARAEAVAAVSTRSSWRSSFSNGTPPLLPDPMGGAVRPGGDNPFKPSMPPAMTSVRSGENPFKFAGLGADGETAAGTSAAGSEVSMGSSVRGGNMFADLRREGSAPKNL